MDDIIKLNGQSYDSQTGRKINDAVSAKFPSGKKPLPATTLNRQFVKKPVQKEYSKLLSVQDKRARKPQVHQFNRGIIPAGATPKAPKISHFHRGDFNNTDKPIILDIKPLPDVVVSREQNQKLIDSLKRAEKLDLTKRHYLAQIDRQRRRQQAFLNQTVNKLNLPEEQRQKNSAKKLAEPSAEIKRARRDHIINQAVASMPSSEELIKNSKHQIPKKAFDSKKFFGRFLIGLVACALLAVVVYANWTNLHFNLAKQQLGINSQIPSWSPSGYELDKLPYIEQETLVLKYSSPDQPKYQVRQTKSNLDSKGLLARVVRPDVGDDYTLYKQNGLTIYIYDDVKAIWSNGGVIYQIIADEGFSIENIQRLATSL